MIRFRCECGRELQAREEHAGKAVTCPSCGRRQTIPEIDAIQPADEEQASVASKRIKRERPREDSDWEEDEEDRPRRRGQPATSGKAITSLVLGLLSLLCGVFTALPAIIVGMLALSEIKNSKGRKTGQGMAIAGIATGSFMCLLTLVAVGLLLPAISRVRDAGARVQSQNNLKMMALAMHNYHDANRCFPPSGISSPMPKPGAGPGQPLLSWRVALLPYLEQQQLYMQFHLDEPWDSPHNKQLLPRMPRVYALPTQVHDQSGNTFYQVVVGPRTLFEPGQKLRLPDVTDGMSKTLLIAEAATPVPWTKPDDLTFDPNGPLPQFGKQSRGGFNAAFADGAVRWIPGDTPESALRAILTRNGGEVVPPNFP